MFKIKDHLIQTGSKPFYIAELSANHDGNLEKALKAIRLAKEAGADAVKLQTYTPDTMTLNSSSPDFYIDGGLWAGETLYSLYEKAYTPFEWHRQLFEYADQLDIILFSTPFDETAVDLLESLNAPAYKIASFELTDLKLIKYAASKGKPMLMSTGMANLDEIHEAVAVARAEGNNDLLLFHCVSSYPAATGEARLNNIKKLSSEFNLPIGLSDHTASGTTSIAATALGVVAIEKHFKIDENDSGPDASFSLTPAELSSQIQEVNLTWRAMGSSEFSRSQSEEANKRFRRSLYYGADVDAGTLLSEKHIRRVRPGYGLELKFEDEIIGKRLKRTVRFADRISLEDFE